MSKYYLGKTYRFKSTLHKDLLSDPRYYELRFSPSFPYEQELAKSTQEKLRMLDKVIDHLSQKNINVVFTDRILDNLKPWEHEKDQEWRYLPIAELQGNNILVNPRNIDFLSIFMSIGHIYGHLVQRMDEEKYRPITDFIELPKPLILENVFAEYKEKYGGNYKDDFLQFEIEAFRYAKFTFIEAGIQFDEALDHAMNVYIEADFNELWNWVSSSPRKDGESFMTEFTKLWHEKKGAYTPLEPKEIRIKVEPKKDGVLVVVRDEYQAQHLKTPKGSMSQQL